jgi:hypothetical protein
VGPWRYDRVGNLVGLVEPGGALWDRVGPGGAELVSFGSTKYYTKVEQLW